MDHGSIGVAFLESQDYEDAVRNAVSIGGDSDTIACMTGAIAEVYYGEIPQDILDKAESILDVGLKNVLHICRDRYIS
ncbi:MAG: ADP-ribosylglycohydrolase family protein [Lachnospiraceae bacterium]|nr:ADP-ribosylglycohydrolase family protein [Lachnospiraceae bacterium]